MVEPTVETMVGQMDVKWVDEWVDGLVAKMVACSDSLQVVVWVVEKAVMMDVAKVLWKDENSADLLVASMVVNLVVVKVVRKDD